MFKIVIDPSVLISATKPKERLHNQCIKLLLLIQRQLNDKKIEIYEPPEFLLELYAVFSRQSRTEFDFNKMKFLSPKNPLHLKILQIREPDVSPLIGLFNKLKIPVLVKGGDLIYLWTSWISKSLLVTADNGLLSFRKYNFNICDPTEYIGINQRKVEEMIEKGK